MVDDPELMELVVQEYEEYFGRKAKKSINGSGHNEEDHADPSTKKKLSVDDFQDYDDEDQALNALAKKYGYKDRAELDSHYRTRSERNESSKKERELSNLYDDISDLYYDKQNELGRFKKTSNKKPGLLDKPSKIMVDALFSLGPGKYDENNYFYKGKNKKVQHDGITSKPDIDSLFDDSCIYHYGVKGMKWGVRKKAVEIIGKTGKGIHKGVKAIKKSPVGSGLKKISGKIKDSTVGKAVSKRTSAIKRKLLVRGIKKEVFGTASNEAIKQIAKQRAKDIAIGAASTGVSSLGSFALMAAKRRYGIGF